MEYGPSLPLAYRPFRNAIPAMTRKDLGPGDFLFMRKEMLGIKRRAERPASQIEWLVHPTRPNIWEASPKPRLA